MTTTALIWNRLLRPDHGDMPPEAARFFLHLAFDQQDLDRMHELTVKNQERGLTPEEQDELRTYRQVGLQLDLLRAKARLSLKRLNGR
jgi:uncharacterized protein YnzC (UPF0291/DUF896 family)